MSKSSEHLLMAHKKGYKATIDGEVISPSGCNLKLRVNSGYFAFTHYDHPVPVHRLVAYQKFGESIFEPGIMVRHLDGNALNNTRDNIDIGTQSDNMMDIPKEKRIKKAMHATSFRKKHDHKVIYDMNEAGMSYKNIMKKLGISSKGTISFAVNQERRRRESM